MNAAQGKSDSSCTRKGWTHSPDVLTTEDPQGLLEGLDLLLPPRHALLVALAHVHAVRLQLLEVVERGVELLLGPLKICLLLRHDLLLVLLLLRLVLDVRGLGRLVNLGVVHELFVLLRRRLLR